MSLPSLLILFPSFSPTADRNTPRSQSLLKSCQTEIRSSLAVSPVLGSQRFEENRTLVLHVEKEEENSADSKKHFQGPDVKPTQCPCKQDWGLSWYQTKADWSYQVCVRGSSCLLFLVSDRIQGKAIFFYIITFFPFRFQMLWLDMNVPAVTKASTGP